MLAEKNFDVVLFGGSKERRELEEKNFAFPENEHIINFIGRTNMKQTLAILSSCPLAVCASGLGLKTRTIFGGFDHRIWTPAGGGIVNLYLVCTPCFSTKRAADCKHHRCLEEINPDMVFSKIMAL